MPFALSRRIMILFTVALLMTLAAMVKTTLAQEAQPSMEPLSEATISITGTGTITAEPDIAVVRAGAVSEAPTARAAMEANTKIMADTFAALRAMGVEDRDMQTSRLTVEPRYTYFNSSSSEERRPPRIDGYQVFNNLTVRVRDLTIIGDVLDALITAGVNQMGGLSFSVDEPDALFDQARADAVEDAVAQAQLLTQAAGVSLGRIISISQSSPQQNPPMQPQFARMAMADSAESVPIATGEQNLRAQVTIIWAIDNTAN